MFVFPLVNLAFLGVPILQNMSDDVYKRLAQFTLARTVTELLMYANHSINFFLYCATGQKFRQQVLNVIQVLCSRANIGPFCHRPDRTRGTGRDGLKEGRYYEADGSSCGGGTNMGRGCYRHSLSAHRTSATALAGHEGLRSLPTAAELGVRQVSRCHSRRRSSYSNDLIQSYVETDRTDNSLRHCGDEMAGMQVNSAAVDEVSKNLEKCCESDRCKADSKVVLAGRGCAGVNSIVAARTFSSGSRSVPGAPCFTDSPRSHCYQMSAICTMRNCSGHVNGLTGFADRTSSMVNCEMRPSNVSSSRLSLGSQEPWDLFRSEIFEINKNKCERKSTGLFKPLKAVSLFKNRSSGGNSSKRKEKKRRMSQGSGRRSPCPQARTDENSAASRVKISRASYSCGNVAGSGGAIKGSFHGCKLHYYSNKRPAVKSRSAETSAAGQHVVMRDNEYVLLTPEMRWCESSTSLS